MNGPLVIQRVDGRWVVMRVGEFARVVAAFDSLHDAEVFAVEHGDPHPEDAA